MEGQRSTLSRYACGESFCGHMLCGSADVQDSLKPNQTSTENLGKDLLSIVVCCEITMWCVTVLLCCCGRVTVLLWACHCAVVGVSLPACVQVSSGAHINVSRNIPKSTERLITIKVSIFMCR